MNLKDLDKLTDAQLIQLDKMKQDLPEFARINLQTEIEFRNLIIDHSKDKESNQLIINLKKEKPFLTAFQMKKHFYNISSFEASKKYDNLNIYKKRFYLGLFCYLFLMLGVYIIKIRLSK
jgi:hypothetical protein